MVAMTRRTVLATAISTPDTARIERHDQALPPVTWVASPVAIAAGADKIEENTIES